MFLAFSALLSFFVLALLAGIPAAMALQPFAPPIQVEREAVLMGTRLRITLSAENAEAGFEAIELAFAEVERWERMLSSWNARSELGRLNRAAPGEWVAVSSELLALLLEVRQWSERTGGAFDPTVGPLIEAWDLRGAGRQPSLRELQQALARSGSDGIELDAGSDRARRAWPGAWMTAGGFGKGAALRGAAGVLRDAGVESALLDFGGQIVAIGRSAAGDRWPVSVAHPAARDRPAVELRLSDVSAATSGAGERFVVVAGRRYGHILDPRSGWPVHAWGSVTVVASDPLVSDILATALFVLGPEAASSLADSLPDVGVLILREVEGELRASRNREMKAFLVEHPREERAFGLGVARRGLGVSVGVESPSRRLGEAE